ncbi:hypothetical protein EPUS_07852 [Endocarpon pusillum Z07020]|uniref:Nephrocystin 3-like N-terminal domain-containing protein n=1 Tax=Endocarpon pusillum (strain Z07020 / HMAS-L-300199) TaxID=1263415 RepID=U1GBL9_ENDPU|nr:uncharacterized protein EPUS_07852 [Endocarpon pusillum Z07020]ERF69448.1 hypothetical protein EPUS_07852 [Endocarpon pusillum Z07020]
MAWVPDTNSIAEPIDAIYNRLKLNRPDYGQLSAEDCIRLIKQVAKGAREEPHRIRFRIIIDALDECEDAQDLLEYLYQAKESCGNIFFMFSSRPDIQIPQRSLPATMVKIEADKSLEDMRFFIRHEIQRRNTKLPGNKRSELEDVLQKELFERAGGMFRWTQIQLEDFLPSTQNRPKLHSKGDFCKRIRDLRERAGAEDLDREYERIYEANTRPGRPSREDAKKAFRILLCCFEPLSLDQLAQATLLEEYGEESSESSGAYIRNICCNFIVVSHSVVQFAHVSARDYLVSRKIRAVNEFDAASQHQQPALSSLQFLESHCGEILKHIKEGQFKSVEPYLYPDEHIRNQVERSLPVELRFGLYAATQWAEHASKIPASVRMSKGLSSQITRFLYLPIFQDWHLLTTRLRRIYGFSYEIEASIGTVLVTQVPSKPNPLCLISAFGFSDCLEFDDINSNSFKVGTKSDYDMALTTACLFGHAEVVSKIFIELPKHAGVNRVDFDILKAWDGTMASWEGKDISEIVRLFLEHGAIARKPLVHKALQTAAIEERLDVLLKVVEQMKKEYDDREILKIMSQTAFESLPWMWYQLPEQYHLAVEFFLGQMGAREADRIFKLKTYNGQLLGEVILLNASKQGSFQTFELMTEKFKVPLNVKNDEGDTALHLTPSTKIANYILCEDKFMVSVRNSEGYTPIMTALRAHSPEVWKTISRHGGNTNERTRGGKTGLHLLSMYAASMNSGSDSDRFFSEYYLKQNLAGIKDSEGNTALHLVNYRWCGQWFDGGADYMLKLMQAGETLLARDNRGETAVERIFSFDFQLETSNLPVPKRLKPQFHRIIIHFMEELRQEERKRLLRESQWAKDEITLNGLAILRDIWHLLLQEPEGVNDDYNKPINDGTLLCQRTYFSFELRPGRELPEVKTYLPTWNYVRSDVETVQNYEEVCRRWRLRVWKGGQIQGAFRKCFVCPPPILNANSHQPFIFSGPVNHSRPRPVHCDASFLYSEKKGTYQTLYFSPPLGDEEYK